MTAARRRGARAPARQRPDNPRRVPADAGDEHRGRHGPDHAGKLPRALRPLLIATGGLRRDQPERPLVALRPGRPLRGRRADRGQIGGGWRLTIKVRVLRQRRTIRGPEPLV